MFICVCSRIALEFNRESWHACASEAGKDFIFVRTPEIVVISSPVDDVFCNMESKQERNTNLFVSVTRFQGGGQENKNN